MKTSGFIAIAFLLLTGFTSLFKIPNSLLFLLLGVLTMALPFNFLTLRNNAKIQSSSKILNFLYFFAFSIFLVASLQAQQPPTVLPKTIIFLILFLTGITILGYIWHSYKLHGGKIFKSNQFLLTTTFVLLLFLITPIEIRIPDIFFRPIVKTPMYSPKKGPLILIDQAHQNSHTLEMGLYTAKKLFEQDGYRVRALTDKIDSKSLESARILVVVNAQSPSNGISSAFKDNEIRNVVSWVKEGGSLFLIADHMPFPAAIQELVTEFGFYFQNGFAIDTLNHHPSFTKDLFTRDTHTVLSTPITRGMRPDESVDSIMTFTGSAFSFAEEITPILRFDEKWVSFNTSKAWNFEKVKPIPIEGYSQGAYRTFGDGRVVVFGEAMMFTTQLVFTLNWRKQGMNYQDAPNNAQLLLNIIHWLDGKMD